MGLEIRMVAFRLPDFEQVEEEKCSADAAAVAPVYTLMTNECEMNLHSSSLGWGWGGKGALYPAFMLITAAPSNPLQDGLPLPL